tara:strand:- start:2353 stop:2505 length:153 start_codon:yes stop_codon:yes gene_type:complete
LIKGKAVNMAENGNMNIEMQNASYAFFVNLFKFGTIAVVVVLILMALFLL